MEELRVILTAHAKRYTLMQPADAVKLIYQNEFGGGHLIRDEEACLNYLRREYAFVEKDPTAPLYDDIGNGIVRVIWHPQIIGEGTRVKQVGESTRKQTCLYGEI